MRKPNFVCVVVLATACLATTCLGDEKTETWSADQWLEYLAEDEDWLEAFARARIAFVESYPRFDQYRHHYSVYGPEIDLAEVERRKVAAESLLAALPDRDMSPEVQLELIARGTAGEFSPGLLGFSRSPSVAVAEVIGGKLGAYGLSSAYFAKSAWMDSIFVYEGLSKLGDEGKSVLMNMGQWGLWVKLADREEIESLLLRPHTADWDDPSLPVKHLRSFLEIALKYPDSSVITNAMLKYHPRVDVIFEAGKRFEPEIVREFLKTLGSGYDDNRRRETLQAALAPETSPQHQRMRLLARMMAGGSVDDYLELVKLNHGDADAALAEIAVGRLGIPNNDSLQLEFRYQRDGAADADDDLDEVDHFDFSIWIEEPNRALELLRERGLIDQFPPAVRVRTVPQLSDWFWHLAHWPDSEADKIDEFLAKIDAGAAPRSVFVEATRRFRAGIDLGGWLISPNRQRQQAAASILRDRAEAFPALISITAVSSGAEREYWKELAKSNPAAAKMGAADRASFSMEERLLWRALRLEIERPEIKADFERLMGTALQRSQAPGSAHREFYGAGPPRADRSIRTMAAVRYVEDFLNPMPAEFRDDFRIFLAEKSMIDSPNYRWFGQDREIAALTLGRLKSPRSLPVLLHLARTTELTEHDHLVSALAPFGKMAFDALRRDLDSANVQFARASSLLTWASVEPEAAAKQFVVILDQAHHESLLKPLTRLAASFESRAVVDATWNLWNRSLGGAADAGKEEVLLKFLEKRTGPARLKEDEKNGLGALDPTIVDLLSLSEEELEGIVIQMTKLMEEEVEVMLFVRNFDLAVCAHPLVTRAVSPITRNAPREKVLTLGVRVLEALEAEFDEGPIAITAAWVREKFETRLPGG